MVRKTPILFAAITAPVLAQASVCDEVADFARKQPNSAWVAGDKALAPALVFDEARSTGAEPAEVDAFEAKLAARADVRDAISATEDITVLVDHLAGTDLYALSTVQGTLHCQSTVLVQAAPGREARIIDAPKGKGDGDDDICWRTSQGLGRAFGHPVFAVHDLIGPTSETSTFTVTPWTGEGWGQTCALKLTFRPHFAISERRCGDEALCKAAEDISLELAVAYNQFQQTGGDGAKFVYGTPGPAALRSEVDAFRAAQESPDTWSPDFPAFSGKIEDHPFSYGGLAMFPIVLAGQSRVVVVGTEGVGWRDSEDTLVGFYDLKGGVLKPQAGYVVERSLAALTKATVP